LQSNFRIDAGDEVVSIRSNRLLDCPLANGLLSELSVRGLSAIIFAMYQES
jgi:hypothetical protein